MYLVVERRGEERRGEERIPRSEPQRFRAAAGGQAGRRGHVGTARE
jgi:hypothetical protein